jgi:hypothetical protein
MARTAWMVAASILVLAACAKPVDKPAANEVSGPATTASGGTLEKSVRSNVARDKGLEIWFEIRPGARMERIALRTLALHFKNASGDPIRIYLPQSEAFRSASSWIRFVSAHGRFVEPDPRPHGYQVTEIDFPLLAPGEERTFEQSFSLDPIVPGPGNRSERRKGFDSGTPVRVSWTYENRIVRWAGGAQTLDGPTKTLFGGNEIPNIWVGKLSVDANWTVP